MSRSTWRKETQVSPFLWNWRGRIAYAPHDRHDMQEYNGWWRHRAFGIYTFHHKATPGWV